MRAVAVDTFGGSPEVRDLPTPTPGPHEVLVRMEAAGMNPFDAKIIDGILRPRPHVFPLVVGIDGAGTVTETGALVRSFERGDRVFGQFLHDPVGTGTYAEFALAPEKGAVTTTPRDLDAVMAAALPTAGMTALDALDRLSVPPGGTLLVIGASGGVGSFVVRLAGARGAKVLALARPNSAQRLLEMGASSVFDRTDPGWEASLRRTYPSGIDALLDLMSGPVEFARILRHVREGGHGATTVYASVPDRDVPPGVRIHTIDLQPSAELLSRLGTELRVRGIAPPVERTISLEQAPAALADLRAGRAAGKTVIRLLGSPGP